MHRDVLVKRQVGHQPFESGVFLFHLTQPAEFAYAQMRILLFPGLEGRFLTPSCQQRPPTGIPLSACRMTYIACSSKSVDHFTTPLLSQGTAKATIAL